MLHVDFKKCPCRCLNFIYCYFLFGLGPYIQNKVYYNTFSSHSNPRCVLADVMLDSCSWCASLLNPYLILGLLIWLALVTLLLLVLICCATYHRKRNQAKYAQNLKWAGSQNDLWKNYDASAKGGSEPRVPSYENPGLEPTYDSIEEGRTAF